MSVIGYEVKHNTSLHKLSMREMDTKGILIGWCQMHRT